MRGDLGTENGHVRDSAFMFISTQTAPLIATWREQARPISELNIGGVSSQAARRVMSALFADLRDYGFFDGSFRDKSLLQFSCMGLIQVSYQILLFSYVCLGEG